MSSYTIDRMDEVAGSAEGTILSGECVGYKVLDVRGRTIGRVQELFLNDCGEPEYVKTRQGLLGAKRSLLLPVAAVRVDAGEQTLILQ